MSIPFTNVIGPQIQSTTSVNQPLVLNEGQMVHGQIKQLFPGQLAEVQIGDQKMIAKLDVPMRAGESYYFQVTSVQPETQLKIIAGPTNAQANTGVQLENLMQAMQLPKSPEMTKLLSFVLENKIPITREGLLQAVKLLQMTPSANHAEALQSIQKLLDLKLPLTQNLFQAILGVESKAGVHSALQSLMNALGTDQSVQPQMKAQVLEVLNQLQKPFGEVTSNATLGEALKVLLNTKESPELRFSVLQLLKDSGVLPREASLPNLQAMLSANVKSQTGLPQAMPPQLSSAQLGNITNLLSKLPFLSAGQKESLMTTLRANGMQPFVQSLMQMIGESLASQPEKIGHAAQQKILSLLNMGSSSTNAASATMASVLENDQVNERMPLLLRNAETTEQPMIRNLVQNAETTVATAMDGKMMKDALQTIFRSLGMNYESALLGKDAKPEQLSQMLKPQLLALLNDASVASNVREAAEQLVVRMNGSPLASVENGVNHQLVMQLPLNLFGKKIDATLQWNGRMKDDKKIDADFARILFYLDLHSLHETVIDMQVQNRIVTVTVFNADDTLPIIGQPLQGKLKEGLSSIGYTLSGVFFKDFVKESLAVKPTKRTETYEGGGLDFRI